MVIGRYIGRRELFAGHYIKIQPYKQINKGRFKELKKPETATLYLTGLALLLMV